MRMHCPQAKELDANTDYYVDLLSKGTGKSYEQIAQDIKRPKYFRAQEAIEYGLADKVIESRGVAMERRVRRLNSFEISCFFCCAEIGIFYVALS
jgi:ClpP class serine protease